MKRHVGFVLTTRWLLKFLNTQLHRKRWGGHRTLTLYITFDLDVLDPTEAPAVSNLESLQRGLRAWQCEKIFHGLRGMNVIGADIVCMIPTKDTAAKITTMTAMAIMYEFIALISDYQNNGQQDKDG